VADRRHALRVPASVDRLAEVRTFVRDSVADLGGSKRVADDLVQAVDEATCNVMFHGYRGEPGEIDIVAGSRDGRIEIRILDRGPAFDPTAAPSPNRNGVPQPTRPGGMGLGIELMRTLTDEVHHSARPGGGNELTLVRSMTGPAEED
jgi:serine/threonine-protein kinase RsbW